MRFGLVIDALDPGDALDDLVARAVAAERLGFDLVWLPDSDVMPSPPVVAAALAPRTSSIRVGIDVRAGGHPVSLAEAAVVADLCLGGRLVLAVGSPDASLMAETVEVLLAATAARPFRHHGERWRIPGNLPENVVNREERIRVTPASTQLELPVWLTGPHAATLTGDFCLTFVGTDDQSANELRSHWQQVEARLGRAAGRLRRVAVRAVSPDADGSVDNDAVVERLRADQRSWGMDVALVRLPPGSPPDTVTATLAALAAGVVPRVQLDRLPEGLEAYWRQRQETVQ